MKSTKTRKSRTLGTTSAFTPKCYSDAIVNDLLDQAGITDVAKKEFPLSRTGMKEERSWK